tara:strand:- start:1590 stop:2156 length:567 start_codon:yes stop_codon:yes gene_type:complete
MERKSIPKPVRIQVWNKYIGEENGIGKCDVCATEIKQTNFDCGHIISAKDGGPDIVNNLVPICRTCNQSMGSDNLNEFKEKYFNDKSYIDIFIQRFIVKCFDTRIVKGFMGIKEYEYDYFVSMNEIYKAYREWIYYNHIRYYESSGMNSYIYSPDRKELETKCKEKFGELVKDPIYHREWGFMNLSLN